MIIKSKNRYEKKTTVDMDIELLKRIKQFTVENSIPQKTIIHEGCRMFMDTYHTKAEALIDKDVFHQSIENQKHLIEINKAKSRQEYTID